MTRITAQNREGSEDIYFGQVVIIWARWFVILAAAILALWSSNDTGELAKRALMVVGLMGVNFFLHGRSLMERPANHALLLATSLIDLAIVGSMVAWWGAGGMESGLYVLYYPLVFAFALVFAQRLSAIYGLLTIATYAGICLLIDPSVVTDSTDAKAVAMRAITLGATAALGSYYWRIQRQRRRTAFQALHVNAAQ